MPDSQDTPTIVDNDIPEPALTGPKAPSGITLDDPRLKPLSPRERVFAMAYGFPGSTTFGNALQSYKVVSPAATDEVAGVGGVRMLNRDRVAMSVADIINSSGLGVEVRADSLKRIISHRDIGRVVSRVKRNEEDGTVETVTESGPSHVATLKAIEVLNKMDGTYERGRVAADVARDEYRDLRKRFFTTMDRPPKASTARTVGPAINAQGQADTQTPPVTVAGQQDTRRKAGRPRKPQAGEGGLSTRPRKVVSLSPEAGEILQGEGI